MDISTRTFTQQDHLGRFTVTIRVNWPLMARFVAPRARRNQSGTAILMNGAIRVSLRKP